MSIHRWKEDFLKKSDVPLELHKGMSKIIIIVCYSFIIPAISIKVILDLIPVSEDPPLPFCSTWIVKTQSDLQNKTWSLPILLFDKWRQVYPFT